MRSPYLCFICTEEAVAAHKIGFMVPKIYSTLILSQFLSEWKLRKLSAGHCLNYERNKNAGFEWQMSAWSRKPQNVSDECYFAI